MYGVEINLCKFDGCSFFYVVCENGCKSFVEFLLKYNVDVKLCDKDGYIVYDYVC